MDPAKAEEELTEAEDLLIFDTLRTDKHFTLTIHQDGSQWHIRHEDHDSGHITNGSGQTFDEAWNAQETPFLRIDDDD